MANGIRSTRVVHVAYECFPFKNTGSNFGLAHEIPRIAQAERNNYKMTTQIIMPFWDGGKEFSGLSQVKESIKIEPKWEKRSVDAKIFQTRVGEVPVYMVKVPGHFSVEKYGIPGNEEIDIKDNIVFTMAVLNFLAKDGRTPDILHGHDWPAGLAGIYKKLPYQGLSSNLIKDMKTILTVHDIGCQGVFGSHLATEFGIGLSDYFIHWDRINLLKAALFYYDGVIMPDLNGYQQIIEQSGLNNIVQSSKDKISSLDGWKPHMGIVSSADDVCSQYLAAYKKVGPIHFEYSTEIEENLDLMRKLAHEWAVPTFMNVKRLNPHEDRAKIIKDDFKTSRNLDIGVVVEGKKERAGSGSAIIGLFVDNKDNIKPEERSDFALNAGAGSRLWVNSLASCLMKGQMPLGPGTSIQVTIDQSLPIFNQFPSGGKGLSIFHGNDNILLFSKLLLGPDVLCPRFGLMLLAVPKRVIGLAPADLKKRLDELEELGVLFANPENGELSDFKEKLKPAQPIADLNSHPIVQLVQSTGEYNCYANTFYMIATEKVRDKIAELYSRPSAKNGKRLFETYGLDWSGHIIEPAVYPDVNSWMTVWNNAYQAGQAGTADKKQKGVLNFDQKDWETLFINAQEVKKISGGIGVVNIGEDAVWLDTGLTKDMKQLFYFVTSDRFPQRRNQIRKLLNIPVDKRVVNSAALNVELPKTHDCLVMNSAFRDGGKVGEHCVIINSLFENYVDIPPYSIVINSHILKFRNNENTMNCYLNNVNSPDKPVELSTEMGYATVFFEDGTEETGIFPINVNPQKVEITPYLNHYNMGDNANKPYLEQTIFGFKRKISFDRLEKETAKTEAEKPDKQYLISLQRQMNYLNELKRNISEVLTTPDIP